jgi:hypothetical protein
MLARQQAIGTLILAPHPLLRSFERPDHALRHARRARAPGVPPGVASGADRWCEHRRSEAGSQVPLQRSVRTRASSRGVPRARRQPRGSFRAPRSRSRPRAGSRPPPRAKAAARLVPSTTPAFSPPAGSRPPPRARFAQHLICSPQRPFPRQVRGSSPEARHRHAESAAAAATVSAAPGPRAAPASC